MKNAIGCDDLFLCETVVVSSWFFIVPQVRPAELSLFVVSFSLYPLCSFPVKRSVPLGYSFVT